MRPDQVVTGEVPRLRFVGDGEQDLHYFVGGLSRGHVFIIPPEGMSLGRGPASLPSSRLSRRHVKLEPFDRGGLLLTELNATNVTAVNGVPAPRGAVPITTTGIRAALFAALRGVT